MSLEINPGEVVALVGRSGRGKSTFCNLLLRFYDPTEGRITIDGQDLKDLNLKHYRRQIGVVAQDTQVCSALTYV